MMTLEEIMNVALWATFCTLCLYSRSLGFIWRPRVAGIAMGFIFYLTVTVICRFIAMRFSFSAGMIANQVSPAAEFLTIAWWLGVFWGEEKLPQASVSELVEQTLVKYTATVEEASRQV
jgi:hypothetical protein